MHPWEIQNCAKGKVIKIQNKPKNNNTRPRMVHTHPGQTARGVSIYIYIVSQVNISVVVVHIKTYGVTLQQVSKNNKQKKKKLIHLIR